MNEQIADLYHLTGLDYTIIEATSRYRLSKRETGCKHCGGD